MKKKKKVKILLSQ